MSLVERQPEAASEPTKLAFALPPGFEVRVDARLIGTTPLHSTEVEAGGYTISIAGPCGEASAKVEVTKGTTARLVPESFPGLQLATLTIDVHSWEGQPLETEVSLEARGPQQEGKRPAWTSRPSGPREPLVVPACSLRLRISSDGLGAFFEDVDFEPGSSHSRSVVLAPGPDMVRIHGGPYVSGPPLDAFMRHVEAGGGSGFDPIQDQVRNEHRVMPTFDLDRTEVTTAQYSACFDAGFCKIDFDTARRITHPDSALNHLCTSEWNGMRPKGTGMRSDPRSGKQEHPVNCVSVWEAERYCEWAGKRLPTWVEWEYASRSRKTDYTWPWGNDTSLCRAHTETSDEHRAIAPSCNRKEKPAAVCSYPEGNSEQGLCDMIGNVKEYVEFPPTDPRHGTPMRIGGSFWGAAHPFQWGYGGVPEHTVRSLPGRPGRVIGGRFEQRVDVGFRCARSVEATEER